MNEIKAWINSGRDYQAGVALFVKHGSSDVLKKIFGRGATPYNANKLLQELVRLSEEVQVKIEDKKELKQTGIYLGNDWERLPIHVKQLIHDAKEKFKEIATLKAQLNLHYTNAKKKGSHAGGIETANSYLREMNAGDLTNTILDLEAEWDAMRLEINYYEENKRMPDASAVMSQELKELSEGDIRSELSRLRPQITKNRTKPARAAEVALWIARKEELERRLDELV